jgi:hypothetical protein
MDPSTEDAIRDFQVRGGQPGTGIMDDATRRRLTEADRQLLRETSGQYQQIASDNTSSRLAEIATRENASPRETERLTESFTRIEAANNAAESSGAVIPSARGTTAGQPASIGAGQLLTRGQVDGAIQQLRNPETGQEFQNALRSDGINRQMLDNINQRGNGAMSWYDLIASNEDINNSMLQNTGLTSENAQDVRRLASQGRDEEIMNNTELVQTFQSRSGLPPEDLRTMIQSRGLQTGAYTPEFERNQTNLSNNIQAARNWSHIMSSNQPINGEMLRDTGLNPEQAQQVRDLVRDGRTDELIENEPLVRQFTSQTRMSDEDLRVMANLGRLPQNARQNATWLENASRENPEIRELAERNPRLANNPENLMNQAVLLRMTRSSNLSELGHLSTSPNLNATELARQGALQRTVKDHPEMEQLMSAHAGESNQLGRDDVLFYMENGAPNENRNGWYTRGAQTSGSDWDRFQRALPNIDTVTNREQSLQSFDRARSIVRNMEGFNQLSPREQEIITGQIARTNQFAPRAFDNHFLRANAGNSVDGYTRWRQSQMEPETRLGTAIRRWTNEYEELQPAETATVVH